MSEVKETSPSPNSSPSPSPKLTEQQLSFVSLIHQHWMLEGSLLTADAAKEKFGFKPKDFTTLMSVPAVRAALAERGVVFERFNIDNEAPEWRVKALTPQQLVAANVMLDLTDPRSNRKKLSDLKVDSKTWAAWLRDPVFREYLDQRTKTMFTDTKYEAYLALMDKVSSGDVKALEFYFEMTGEYTRQRAGTNTNDFDFRSILIRIVEIITEEVHDPQVAATIADRIKGLGQAHQVAQSFNDNSEHQIVIPTVAPARELSPKLKALQDKGVGINQ